MIETKLFATLEEWAKIRIREHYKWLKPEMKNDSLGKLVVLENTISDWNGTPENIERRNQFCIREHYKWLKQLIIDIPFKRARSIREHYKWLKPDFARF